MKFSVALCAFASAVALLAGCASTGTTVAGAQLDANKAFIVAETGFDAAVKVADSAIATGKLSPTQVRAVQTLVDVGHGYLVKGRAAIAAADTVAAALEASNLTALAGEISGLVK